MIHYDRLCILCVRVYDDDIWYIWYEPDNQLIIIYSENVELSKNSATSWTEYQEYQNMRHLTVQSF